MRSVILKINFAQLGVTVYNISQEGFTTANTLDFVFGVAGFIPGVGWMISGSYFLVNTGVQLYSGKSIGEHFDE